MLRRFISRSLLMSAILSIASVSQAASFSQDGSFLFEPDAVLSEGFEAFPVDLSGTYSIIKANHPLEGSHHFSCATQYESVDISLSLPNTAATYEASLWMRGDGIAGVSVGYEDDAAGDLSQLFPTGRATSDGWIELRSAPFSVDGPRNANAIVFVFGEIEIDAIEVRRSQAAFHAPKRCSGLQDPSCTGDQLCVAGWCRNASGWVPPLPDDRRALATYLQNRMRFFFGPYLNRERYLPAAIAESEAMATAPSRWRFWNGFTSAVRRLRDTHTSAFPIAAYFLDNPRLLNACFTLGDADLSQSQAPSDPQWPDVLVSHTGDDHHWNLHPGDRVVAVDGIHPIAWVLSLMAHDPGFSAANDPTSLATYAESLRSSVTRYARTLTVIRCDGSICKDPEDIDVLSVPELPQDQPVQPVACDHRPSKLVANQPDDHRMGVNAFSGFVNGTNANDKIYGLVWDYLITGTPAQTTIASAVASWRSDARAVILDHRTGNGGSGPSGSTSIADPILAFTMPPTLFGVSPFRHTADDEGPKTIAEGFDLLEKYANTSSAWRGGGPDPRSDVPVALLITRDVSFSDLFPQAFRGGERVRIFGPNPTHGAFSSFYGTNYWSGLSFQQAAGDTIGAEGLSLSGRGAQPHESVLPKQSDLVAGIDTLVVSALSWIQSELEP